MDIVTSQPRRMSRLGPGSILRGLCSNPINSRQIVMKNLLVGIGFIFEDVTALELKEKLDQQWQDMYQKLLEHKETNGHCFK
eukprot:scaffold3083_cov260-Chaetoceros_neogracile.AAC.2